MKRKNSKTSATFARRRFLVEGLEPRCLLAGNVNVFVSGGTLFVQGDGADNAVLIQQEGTGEYSVTPLDFADLELTGNGFTGGPTTINNDPETIQGEPLFFSGVTNDINVDLRGGNDGLGIGNDVNTLNNLALDCFDIGFVPEDGGGTVAVAEVGTLFVPRNLIVNLGEGNDFTAIDANVGSSNPNGSVKKGGVAVINLGNGNNGAAFGHGTVADDLLINGGNGNDNACVTDVFVRDLLAVQLGDGHGNTVDAHQFDAGHVLVTTGNGNDDVTLGQFDTDREVVVVTGNGNDTAFISDFSAGQGDGPAGQHGAGFVTVVTGNGNDEAELNDFGADGVTIDTGAGNDGSPSDGSPITVHDATITHQLTVVTGAGNDFVDIDNITAHDIFVDTGAGDDGNDENQDFPIEVDNCTVAGNVTVLGGSGNDRLEVRNEFDEGNSPRIGGNLVVNAGAGNDNVRIRGDIGNGEGENAAPFVVGHDLIVDAGAGDDTVTIDDLTVRNNLFAFLGAGNDVFASDNESGANNLTVNGNALIDAGAGNDTVTVDTCVVGKTATILMGSGDDTLNLFNSSANKFVARGGSGKDTFNNDLGITKNGKFGNADVQEFELFSD